MPKEPRQIRAYIKKDGTIVHSHTKRINISNKMANQIRAKEKYDTTPDDLDLEGWKKKAREELEKETDLTFTEADDNPGDNRFQGEDGLFLTDGDAEYFVFEDASSAETAAVANVREDLDNEPEIFSQDWLEGFIDEENLRNMLEDDVNSSNRNYWDDIADEGDDEYINRQRSELVDAGEITEEEAKDENFDTEDAVERMVESRTEEDMRDPIEYLEGIYGREDAMKEAIRIAGIDVDEAAQDAVDTDGVGHFMSSYDGEEIDLPSGAVAFRVN